MRTIRNVGPESIDQYMEVYLNSYPAFKSLDDDCYAHYEEKTLLDMTTDPDVDFVGMFEDEKMIAIMKVVHFRINLFGRMQSAYGLMSLGVHPLYKKQHAALEMVREFERRAAAEGTLLTLLLPFRMDFYRGMGYGYGTRMDEYRIPVASLPKAVKDTGRRFELELVGKDAVPEMVDCYNAVCADNHGALQKFSEEARLMGLSASPRRLVCRENGEMVGYLVWHYDQQNDTNYTLNTLVVEEMVYADGDVLQQLLSFLRKQADLAQSLVLRTGEEDFYHLLEDAADTSGNYIDFGYLQTNVSAMGSMYKVFDPERFIKGTAYRVTAEGDLTARFLWNEPFGGESRSITVRFRDRRWRVVQSFEYAAEPDVTAELSLANLSSVLMGSCSLSSLVRLGACTVSDPAEADRLSALLRTEQKPWSNNDY